MGGRAFLYGSLVGLLLGAMIDTLRASRERRDGQEREARAGPLTQEPADNSAELECLYSRFGLKPGVPSGELSRRFKERSKLCLPDLAGGSSDEFLALKSAYDRIRSLEKERYSRSRHR